MAQFERSQFESSQFEPSQIAADAAVRDRFIDALRTTRSVVAAAQATGTTRSTAYAMRRRDPAFAAAWTAALTVPAGHGVALAALERALIRRATNGVRRTRKFADDSVETWVEYDTRLALALLGRLATPGPVSAAPPPRTMTREEFIAIIRSRPKSIDLAV